MLSAYYFRQHMYTLVPRYVREDMAWLADVGTDAVAIAILEQDFWASDYNVRFIADEAHRAGMKVLAVPSRWAGVVAGSPKVPSTFSAQHPETLVLDADGQPHKTAVSGVLSSVFHPATEQFMRESVDTLLTQWPIAGIIWDEIKVFLDDRNPAVAQALGEGYTWADYLAGVAGFFGRLNRHAKSTQPDVLTSMFLYADLGEDVLGAMSATDALDEYGCDGRPWREEDGQGPECGTKRLFGPGERHIAAARASGKRPLMLIENHALTDEQCGWMDRRLPELLVLDVDHWLYYYYGRNCEDPDRVMAVMARHLKARFAG